MKNNIILIIVMLLLGFTSGVSHAQTMNVNKIDGSSTAYPLSNLGSLTFSTGMLKVNKSDKTTDNYAFTGMKNIQYVLNTSVAVTGVTVSPTTASLVVGGTQQLTATAAPANATNKNVTWASSNSAVATVNATGLVTAVAAGTANITVTTVDGARTAVALITVTAMTDALSALNGPTAVTAGSSISVNVNYTASASREIVVALQDPDNNYNAIGVQTVQVAMGSGTATATFTVSSASATRSNYRYVAYMVPVGGSYANKTAEIIVNNIAITSATVAVTGVTVSPTTASLVVGGTQQLTATVAPANATNKNVTWASSNTAVATVNATGLVTAVAAGTAIITATTVDGARTATSIITVTATPVVSNLALNKPLTFSQTTTNTLLVDGIRTNNLNYWRVPSYPGWAEVDLGANYVLTKVDIYTHAYYQGLRYRIEVKASGSSTYTTVVDRTGNTTLASSFSNDVNINGRYVKITVIGSFNNAYNFAYVNEMEVYGYATGSGRMAAENTPLQVENVQAITLYPNPVTGSYLYVQFAAQSNEALMEIYEATGKLVYTQHGLNDAENPIPIGGFKRGLYFLRIHHEGKIMSKKFMVE